MNPENYLRYFDETYKEKLEAHRFFADRYNGFRKIFETLLKKKPPFTIIETGAFRKRDVWTDGQSSFLFFEFLNIFGGKLISIDNDAQALKLCEEILTNAVKRPHKAELILINGNSVEELEKINEKADLVYLDSFDINPDNPEPSAAHHLKELVSLRNIMGRSTDLLIGVDDNFYRVENGKYTEIGKGKYITEWARETKKRFIHDGYQKLFIA